MNKETDSYLVNLSNQTVSSAVQLVQRNLQVEDEFWEQCYIARMVFWIWFEATSICIAQR